MLVSERLVELGIELPEVVPPVAAYVPARVIGNTVRTSGQLPMRAGELIATGRLGVVSVEDGYAAARQCALNAVAAAAAVAGGVDKLGGVLKVTGFVASEPDFYAQPAVVNGASEILGEIFGDQHIRSAVGVAALPLNASVEVEVEFALV
ncbi:endoribonuclease L-PSP [Gleimia coleocanis DSM 15436]|uniref:Endoribonuclease L-PSP n=1 Tax=Gleimia coleocanis DSM 15436 TaxID=525245 RepID=C0W299_9ACTO|nr:RidA family protein [Gleimia coleocanis]EEH63204.1 endoribonuclease L-PSP [Gleimia coleocanis DSM 15436]